MPCASARFPRAKAPSPGVEKTVYLVLIIGRLGDKYLIIPFPGRIIKLFKDRKFEGKTGAAAGRRRRFSKKNPLGEARI